MKISELIQFLEREKQLRGDMTVCVWEYNHHGIVGLVPIGEWCFGRDGEHLVIDGDTEWSNAND